jgi:hypothetical protein
LALTAAKKQLEPAGLVIFQPPALMASRQSVNAMNFLARKTAVQ